MNSKQSLIGGAIAFVLASACCWLPAVIIILGGATGMLTFSESLERYSALFMIIGVALLGFGLFKLYVRKKTPKENTAVQLQSVLKCPHCGFEKIETMPTDSCQFFYECTSCMTNLKPKENDCCVYCSYGTVACPPIQIDQGCC